MPRKREKPQATHFEFLLMAGEKRRVIKGCIKGVQGAWLVHRVTKDGRKVTKLRFPSTRERQNNKKRERERRQITGKIFSGLKAYGNYHLPKHADRNDILKVLCEEAGWNVDEDGNVSRKNLVSKEPSLINSEVCQVGLNHQQKEDEEPVQLSSNSHMAMEENDGYYEVDIDLSLSLFS